MLFGAMMAFATIVSIGASQAAPPSHTPASSAANASRHAEEEPLGPISTSEKQGYGCIIAGGAALALTAITGTTEVIGLFRRHDIPRRGIGDRTCRRRHHRRKHVRGGSAGGATAIRLWRTYYDGAPIVAAPP